MIGGPVRKGFFFSHCKAEWSEMGITITVSRFVPIILCAPLVHTDLVVQQKRRMLLRDTFCETAYASASCKSETWAHFVFGIVVQTKNKMQTLLDYNYTQIALFCTSCNVHSSIVV